MQQREGAEEAVWNQHSAATFVRRELTALDRSRRPPTLLMPDLDSAEKTAGTEQANEEQSLIYFPDNLQHLSF